MRRTFRDDVLEEWEVVSTSRPFGGPAGGSGGSRLVFRSLSDPGGKPRILTLPDSPTEAARRLRDSTGEELRGFLQAAL